MATLKGMTLVYETTVSHPQQTSTGSVTYVINHNKGKPILWYRGYIIDDGKRKEQFTNHYNTAHRYGLFWGQDLDPDTNNSYRILVGRMSGGASGPFDLVIHLYA